MGQKQNDPPMTELWIEVEAVKTIADNLANTLRYYKSCLVKDGDNRAARIA